MTQQAVDTQNAEFWDTICGTNLAQAAGITGRGEDDLRRFDELYFGYYPYLKGYVPADLTGKKVLEIGLGFGTLGQLLAERGADYHGVDIAVGPVEMMRRRLEWLGRPVNQARQGSALELPYPDGTFDDVYSIGCLHHTGDLPKSVDEVHRVLKPGGCAVVMLYNRRSLRRVALAAGKRLKGKSKEQVEQEFRAIYDAADGEGAPHTDFTSRRDARRLFAKFDRLKIDVQNFDGFRWGLQREYFLGNLARLVGLDLYIVAYKKR